MCCALCVSFIISQIIKLDMLGTFCRFISRLLSDKQKQFVSINLNIFLVTLNYSDTITYHTVYDSIYVIYCTLVLCFLKVNASRED